MHGLGPTPGLVNQKLHLFKNNNKRRKEKETSRWFLPRWKFEKCSFKA